MKRLLYVFREMLTDGNKGKNNNVDDGMMLDNSPEGMIIIRLIPTGGYWGNRIVTRH